MSNIIMAALVATYLKSRQLFSGEIARKHKEWTLAAVLRESPVGTGLF